MSRNGYYRAIDIWSTIIIVVIISIFLTAIVSLCISESSKVYVNYVGEITDMNVKYNDETCQEQFFLTVRLSTGDERIVKVNTNLQSTSLYFTLEIGTRYNFKVQLVENPDLDYHGTLIEISEPLQGKAIYESN